MLFLEKNLIVAEPPGGKKTAFAGVYITNAYKV